MTLFLIQNFKTLNLCIFFFIYCSTYLFLSNIELRLIFGYPTIHYPHLMIKSKQIKSHTNNLTNFWSIIIFMVEKKKTL